jgi:hypothetical protein
MEAVRDSETSVHFNEPTRRYIPEGCHLHTHRLEDVNSYIYLIIVFTKRIFQFWGSVSSQVKRLPVPTG